MRSENNTESSRIVKAYIWLVAIHSILVGLMLFLIPDWSVRFAGWHDGVTPLFFARQAGIFHFILAYGYLLEWYHCGGIRFLVLAKTLAFIFLVGIWFFGEVAWSVPLSGVSDGLMGLGAWVLFRFIIKPKHQSTPVE